MKSLKILNNINSYKVFRKIVLNNKHYILNFDRFGLLWMCVCTDSVGLGSLFESLGVGRIIGSLCRMSNTENCHSKNGPPKIGSPRTNFMKNIVASFPVSPLQFLCCLYCKRHKNWSGECKRRKTGAERVGTRLLHL